MSTVYWTPMLRARGLEEQKDQVAHLLFGEPAPLMQMLVEQNPKATYLKCPALIDACKNTFVVVAPLDVTLTLDKENNRISTTFPQHFFDKFCSLHEDNAVSFPPAMLFFSTESVIAEVLTVPMLESSALKNTAIVPGMFDVSKWIRPVEFGFIVRDASQQVVIKKGDPLFALRLRAADGSKVSLERVEHTTELVKMTSACTTYKDYVKGASLKMLYDLASQHVNLFLARYQKRKCPFGFGEKK